MTFALSLPLNRPHVLEQLARLVRVYKRPAHAPADDTEFATDYAQLCGELTAGQFTGAVDAYLKSASKFFPRPGELLALGRVIARGPGDTGSLSAQYAAWEAAGWQDPATGRWTPCPVCDARMQDHVVRITATGNEITRLKVLHNATVHWKAGIGFTMGALPGTGGGRYEHTIIDQRPKTIAPPAPTDEELERAAIEGDA